MNEAQYNQLRETNWRRKLDAGEEARLQTYLAAHPEAHADWEAEAGLNQLLEQLLDAPLASNFTARVLQAADRETVAAQRWSALREWFAGWISRPVPRVAWATVLMGLAFLGYQQYQTRTHDQLAKALVRISGVTPLQEPRIFQDFEVIQRLDQLPPPADEELWMALNQ